MNQDAENLEPSEAQEMQEMGNDSPATNLEATSRKPFLSKGLKLLIGSAVVMLVFANAMLYAAPDRIESMLPSFITESLGIAGQSGCSA